MGIITEGPLSSLASRSWWACLAFDSLYRLKISTLNFPVKSAANTVAAASSNSFLVTV